MLPKIYRLPAREKFTLSKNSSNDYVRVLVKPNALLHNRFGFVISKKIDKRAVVRNRLRRVLSECVKGVVKANGEQGKDMLFIVKKSFIEKPTSEVFAMIQPMVRSV